MSAISLPKPERFSGRHARWRIVAIDDDLTVEVGDPVPVKTYGCSEALGRVAQKSLY